MRPPDVKYSGAVARTASITEARRRLPTDFVESLAASFPQPLVDTILRGMGAPRRTTLRVNSLRATPEELERFLRGAAVKFRRVPWYRDAFILLEHREREVQSWDWYRDGRIYLQSLSSMLPALALEPMPGDRVLDMAAAPGSKTTQMAALMGNEGWILAVEKDALRAQRLRYNAALQGCSIVEIREGRGEKIGVELPESFDRVLLDVPCSGEGRFLTTEPSSFRRWSPRAVSEHARLQRRLLASGARALRPGGVLVYSTCTLNLRENEEVISWAMGSLPLETEGIPLRVPGSFSAAVRGFDPRVGRALRLLPDAEREGFFVCRMRKRSENEPARGLR